MVSSLAKFRHRLTGPPESTKKCVYNETSRDTTLDEKFPLFTRDLYFSVFPAPVTVKDRRVDDDKEADPDQFFEFQFHLGSGRLGKSYVAVRKDLRPYPSSVIPKKDPKLLVTVTKMDAKRVDYVDAIRACEPFIIGKEASPFLGKVLLSFRSRLPYLVEHYWMISESWHSPMSVCKYLQKVECMPEPDAKFYLVELALALACIHEHGKVLRRLSMCNLLIDPLGHLKLVPYTLCEQNLDCGQSCNMLVSCCGDQFYASPEVVFGADAQFATDWWSFGVIMYQILTGKLPFNGRTLGELGKAITESPVNIPDCVSGEAAAILKHLLHKDPRRRLGYSETGVGTARLQGTLDVQNHPFFQRVFWRDVTNNMLDPPLKPRDALQTTMEKFQTRTKMVNDKNGRARKS